MEDALRARCISNAMIVQVWHPFPHKVPKTAALTVGKVYDVKRDEPERIMLTNDKGYIAAYPADMFEEEVTSNV